MNSNKKENIAITAIINEVNKFDNIEDNLRKRDKEPVWDGDLMLYKNDSLKKSNIVGRIPVQVKGTNKKENNKINTYYDVEIVDIENYRKDNKGAIFFVVEIGEDRTTQIYYKIFDLETIQELLSKNTKNRKTKRIKFKKLESNELIDICIEFIKRLNVYKKIEPISEIKVCNNKVICYDNIDKYELEEAKKFKPFFCETNVYLEAKRKLEKQNIIILHGEPWVGKTTTAKRLVEDYIDKGYIFKYGNVDDLVDIKKSVAVDEKIICLIDDFLGSNVQYLEKNVAESTLDKIVRIFKNSDNKKLILTTRTYIYNNAKKLFYKFHHATSIKDEYLIDVANYNYMEKGNILYNHMKLNGLIGTDKHAQIVKNEFYKKVIEHQNYNPGTIALICERMKNKENLDVKKYILSALNSPEQLWDEEYEKLNIYEKIILVIIVLFGVKVPEKYVKEQFDEIIKIENIKLLEESTFSKSIDVLSNSFLRITFDNNEEKELEVCKHSVADYIINKISNKEIDIDRYINSAKYAEVLHYIDIALYNDKNIKEKLAQKVEKDIVEIKEFLYDGLNILYNLLRSSLNKDREKILKNIIDEEIYHNPNIILGILERDYDLFYEYTINKFQDCIIETDDVDLLYMINQVWDCETYFKTCLILLDYEKNSEYMMNNFYAVEEVLTAVVSEYVEEEINETLTKFVAKDIIEGKTLDEVINEFIESIISDEIPSLMKLYDRKTYKELIENVCKFQNVKVDYEILNKTIEEVKEKLEDENIDDNDDFYYNTTDTKTSKEQIKYIKEKFENGIEIEKTRKEEKQDSYYNLLGDKIIRDNRYYWWTESFVEENTGINYINLKLYKEFLNERKDIDKSLLELAKEFLEYIFEKNNISKEAKQLLSKIAYENLKKGKYEIEKITIKKFEEKNNKQIKELYKANLILNIEGEYRFINSYIYLYLATNELVKNKDNIIFLYDKEQDDNYVKENKQKIFELYSQINTSEFNKNYIIPALKSLVIEVENRYKKIGKINISKFFMYYLEPELSLDIGFNLISIIEREFIPMDFIEFVTGVNLWDDLENFDYGIYQKILFDKCFNEEEQAYILDFNKILKDKELKMICAKIKIWDYIYDIYLECKKTLEKLEGNNNINCYHISEETIKNKYFRM